MARSATASSPFWATGLCFLVLLVSAEGVQVKSHIDNVLWEQQQQMVGNNAATSQQQALRRLQALHDAVDTYLEADEGVESTQEKDHASLSAQDILDIQTSLRKHLMVKDSPMFAEVDEIITPINMAPDHVHTDVELAKHSAEISRLLHKASQPLAHLGKLLQYHVGDYPSLAELEEAKWGTVGKHVKSGASWVADKTVAGAKFVHQKVNAGADYVETKVTGATTGKNLAQGECEKSTTFGTCGGNEDCGPSKSNPCKGFCQCNTDGLNNCECVQEITFPPMVSHVMDDEKDIGKALTMGGAALSAVIGFTDGFTGGMVNDFRASWKSDPECAELKEDFSSGLKDIVRQFKAVLHVMSNKVKSVLISRDARQAILRKVKHLLKSVINFLGEVVPGLWNCPATRQIVIVLTVIAGAVAANLAFLAMGWAIVPIIIKWVGAIVGLIFSFAYLKKAIQSLYHNIKLAVRKQCPLKCKELITEKSFAILGCVSEILLMGGIGEVISFAKKNPAKIASQSKGGMFQWNEKMLHDIRVVKSYSEKAKHGMKASKKSLKTITSQIFNMPGSALSPIKNMDDAAKLMAKNKFACSSVETGPIGKNPIMDHVKAQKKKLQKMKGRKEGQTKFDEEMQGARNNAQSFHKGEYNVVVLDEPITLYRAGPADRKMSQFWTRTPPKNRFEVRYDAAVKKEWSNLDTVYSLELPAGTRMYEGYVAPQGGKYVGLGKQIFINKPWEIPGVSEDMVKVVGKWKGKAKGFDYVNGVARYLKGKLSSAVGLTKNTLGLCDNRRWHGVEVRKHGKCEKTHVNGCQDGYFIKGYCRNDPANVKCCVRQSCEARPGGVSGMCVAREKCLGDASDEVGITWKTGLCPGSPSWLGCCLRTL